MGFVEYFKFNFRILGIESLDVKNKLSWNIRSVLYSLCIRFSFNPVNTQIENITLQ